MAQHEVWRGSTGVEYRYLTLEIGARPQEVYGNYIFAKRNPSGGWDAVYVGQGDLSTRADINMHHRGDYIRTKGATHVHIRENLSLQERMLERADILDAHPEAYEPAGCHKAAS